VVCKRFFGNVLAGDAISHFVAMLSGHAYVTRFPTFRIGVCRLNDRAFCADVISSELLATHDAETFAT